MDIYNNRTSFKGRIKGEKKRGARIGFVPTMGYLHSGHTSLVETLRPLCDTLVVSIFVNPLQFNDRKDFLKYPIDLERDKRLLVDSKADILFLPSEEDLYPKGHQSRVIVESLSAELEGVFRPGHFEGVTTVVSMLFNLVEPDTAIFGEKDFQQLRVIEQMVSDLHMPVEIIRGKLIREESGLAMSSRNVLLSEQAKIQALSLSAALFEIQNMVQRGCSNAQELIDRGSSIISSQSLAKLEYVSIVEENTLKSVLDLQQGVRYRALCAAFFDGVRLIDNVAIGT